MNLPLVRISVFIILVIAQGCGSFQKKAMGTIKGNEVEYSVPYTVENENNPAASSELKKKKCADKNRKKIKCPRPPIPDPNDPCFECKLICRAHNQKFLSCRPGVCHCKTDEPYSTEGMLFPSGE